MALLDFDDDLRFVMMEATWQLGRVEGRMGGERVVVRQGVRGGEGEKTDIQIVQMTIVPPQVVGDDGKGGILHSHKGIDG